MKNLGRSVLQTGSVLLGLLMVAAVPAAGESLTGSYWYIIDNIESIQPGAEVTVLTALPFDRPGQRVRITTIDPEPAMEFHDEVNGNRIVTWRLTPTDGVTHLFCHYEFQVDLEAVIADAPTAPASPYDRDSFLFKRFTAEEFGVELDGPVRNLAAEIVGAETHPYRRARLIFDWMVAHLEFVPGGTGDWSSAMVARSRRGDCRQYGLLFTALCRSLEIPARTFTCAWLTGGRHVLAEFFLPGHGWLPVDPSVAQLMMPGSSSFSEAEVSQFLSTRGIPAGDPGWLFGNLYPNRLIISVGNNIEVPIPDSGTQQVFTYLEPGGDKASPPAFRFSGLNGDIVHGGFFHFGDQPLDPAGAHQAAHQVLAASYFDAGLYEKVEEGCLETLAGDQSGVTAWMNLGRVYLRKGEYNKAEASFQRALKGQANLRREKLESRIWAHNYLGNCYDLLGRRELARAQYEEVITMNNNYRGAVEYARRYLNNAFTPDDF